MKKKIFASALLSAALLLPACQEFAPVTTLTYPEPLGREPEMLDVNTTIAELKALYVAAGNKLVEINDHLTIGGQVISSDRSGNIYRDLYIQDDTGAICVKVGKSSLYSDFHPGQWVFVDCAGLTLGSYSGMPQLGVLDETGEYDTAYIDAQYLIDTHIFRGRIDTPPAPRELTAAEVEQAVKDGGFKNSAWGSLVTLKGLTYGAKSDYSTDSYKRIFALLYVDQQRDKKSSDNRIFLSDKTYGVNTWAMSKNKFLEYLDAGNFDGATTGAGLAMGDIFDAGTGKTVSETLRDNAVAVTLSHYFTMGSTPVQIRTSGYAKFADTEIPAAVLGSLESSSADGAAIDVTGLLTLYGGAAQFTLIDLDGVVLSGH